MCVSGYEFGRVNGMIMMVGVVSGFAIVVVNYEMFVLTAINLRFL